MKNTNAMAHRLVDGDLHKAAEAQKYPERIGGISISIVQFNNMTSVDD